MMQRSRFAPLVPHQGAMLLLDTVEHWTPTEIVCRSRAHLDPANPLRQNGRLAAICGVEFAMQAAALHGALCAGEPQPAGYVATLRDVALDGPRLDDPAHGLLRIGARLESAERHGLLYAFTVATEAETLLVSGRASIALPRDPKA